MPMEWKELRQAIYERADEETKSDRDLEMVDAAVRLLETFMHENPEPFCNHDTAAVDRWTGRCECGVLLDVESSASRQHWIDTGHYLKPGEAIEA